MKYKIIKGAEFIEGIFEKLRITNLVKTSYVGNIVLNILDGFNGVIYEPKGDELEIVGEENNSLVKKFREVIASRNIKLEKIK